jgi:hypothetical protein
MLRSRSLADVVRRTISIETPSETASRQRSPLPLNCEFDPVDGGGGDRLDTTQWDADKFRDNFCLHLRTGKFGECTYGDCDGTLRSAR